MTEMSAASERATKASRYQSNQPRFIQQQDLVSTGSVLADSQQLLCSREGGRSPVSEKAGNRRAQLIAGNCVNFLTSKVTAVDKCIDLTAANV